MTTAPVASAERDRRDRGAALPLVLVMMVILSLVIIPTLNYAVSVVNANNVLSDKNERVEAVKAGLRIALADPEGLYEECNPSNSGYNLGRVLASVDLNGHTVRTECYLQDSARALDDDELRVGVAATQLGMAPPVELWGSSFSSAASTSEWLGLTSVESVTDQIWLPRLPVSALTLERANGRQMSSGFDACTVYFPGTYLDPLVLDGPTYFTTGIYYFESEVRVEGGADVVVGGGAIPGCTNDLNPIYYTVDPPDTVSMNGLGSTWVFGNRARLVVDNSNGSELSLVFNRRYAQKDDPSTSPSRGVSIISVNGELDVSDNIVDLAIPNVIDVPRSMVGAEDPPAAADAHEYVPSRFSPRPKEPEPPTNVVASAYDAAVVVSWDAAYDNNELVTGYRVTASPGGESCTTNGATTCAIDNLDDGDPIRFSVVATNALGDSATSRPSEEVTPEGSSLSAPSQPAAPSVDETADGTARVSWTEPSSDAPITSYRITASPGAHTCDLDVTSSPAPPLTCDVTGLSPSHAPGYSFRVVATSEAGSSSASLPSAAFQAIGSPPLDPIEPVPPPTPTGPPPLVDISVGDPATAVVDIPGYIATPQAGIRIENPHGHAGLRVGGGILAADYDVVDSRMTPGAAGSLEDIGFINEELQRKYLLISCIPGEIERSRAIVQVNENGGHAVNSWMVQPEPATSPGCVS